MSFTPKISLTDSDIREDESVSLVVSTLKGHGVKTQLGKGDKGANIDGYIELLDSENRLSGKVTVQVKTVPPIKEGLFEFACPTSLFAYAERTTEVVLLLAVDHKNKIVLWKHISNELIEANRGKEDQGTITLHFSREERLTQANADTIVGAWHTIVQNQIKRFTESPSYQKELLQIKEFILSCQSLPLDLPPEEIAILQSFLDDYNNLMSKELSFIKEFFYPNVWKFGLAFSEFSNYRVFYATFPINKGEQLAEMRRLPSNNLWNLHSLSVHGHYISNPFLSDYKLVIKEQVKQHIDFYLKNVEIPELEPFAIETIMAAFRKDSNCRVIPKENRSTFSNLASWIKEKFPEVNSRNVHLHSGFEEYHITDIYNALNLLLKLGIDQLKEPYAPKGSYSNTGYIFDWYNADFAFQKMRYVISSVNHALSKFLGSFAI